MDGLGVAAVALGIGMITDFSELATEKVPRGTRQRLCDDQVIQSQRAQAEARLGCRPHIPVERSRRDLGKGGRDRRVEPRTIAFCSCGGRLVKAWVAGASPATGS